jgi:hypothetical protein
MRLIGIGFAAPIGNKNQPYIISCNDVKLMLSGSLFYCGKKKGRKKQKQKQQSLATTGLDFRIRQCI